MKNRDKKLIIILIALIVLVIVIINIFSRIVSKDSTNKKNENNKQYEDEIVVNYEKKGKYEANIINSDYLKLSQKDIEKIDTTIELMVQYINQKKYTELYKLTLPKYKQVRFDTQEKFEKFLKDKFPNSDYECVSYGIDGNFCNIYLCSKSDEKNEYKEIRVLNYKNLNGQNIYFENIRNIEQAINYSYVGDIMFNMNYIIEYDDKVSAVFKIKNKTKDNVEIIFEEYKMSNNNRNENVFLGLGPEKVSVNADETKQVEIDFEKNKKSTSIPERIAYTVKVNGVLYDKEVFITPEEEEY